MGETSDDELWGDLVTAERAAKGDLDLTRHEATGYIRHARIEDRRALAFLIRSGTLSESHSYYASVFADLRMAFLRRVDHQGNSAYASSRELFGSEGGNGVFETMYPRVCRKLPPRAEGLIQHAMSTVIPAELWDATHRARDQRLQDRLDRLLFWKRPNREAPIQPANFAAAFDGLIEAIDYVRKHTCHGCGAYEDNACVCD